MAAVATLAYLADVCSESSVGGRFVFDIDVKLPLIGQLIHYRGWLLQQGQGR